MGRFWTPRPTMRGVAPYECALLQRFQPAAYNVKEEARKAATTARDLAAVLRTTVAAMEPSQAEPIRSNISALDNAATKADTIVATWDVDYAPYEAASNYVSGSLDLQVGKAGGLLAFNALAVAIGLIIWTERGQRSYSALFRVPVFLLLLVSSTLSLAAVWSWWGSADDMKTAKADLTASLRFAAWRSLFGNVATFCTTVATALIIGWIFATTAKNEDNSQRPARIDSALHSAAPSPSDTLHARCRTIEGRDERRRAVENMLCDISR